MMKIYYVANACLPNKKAHTLQLIKMCEAFIKNGIELELVVPRVFGNKMDVREFYRLNVAVPIKTLPAVSFFSNTRFGFNLRALSFMLSSALFFLAKRIRKERVVIYTIDLDQFSFSLLPLSGFPVFFEAHGAKRKNFLTRFFLNHTNGIITNSEGTLRTLERDFGLKFGDGASVEPNGIDMEHFGHLPEKDLAREKLNLSKNEKIALYAGRFYGWKGLDIVVDAAKMLPCVSFYFVGGDKSEFHKVVGEKKIMRNMIFIGSIPHIEVPLWLAAADTLIVLGTENNEYSWRETSPMKLFEYMASKRPIVASATPANMEIVSDKEVFFYKPDNPTSLAGKITEAVGSHKNAGTKSESARKKVVRWAWEKRAQRIKHFIESKI